MILIYRKYLPDKLRPVDDRAHYHLGITYYKGMLFDAMRELRQTVRLNPGHTDATLKLRSILDAVAGTR